MRRIILLLGAVVILAMLMCPPWLHASRSYSNGGIGDFHGSSSSHGEYDAGYHLLFRPPEESHINVQLLLLQIGAIGLVTWFASAAARKF
jgi:hypothetical protein